MRFKMNESDRVVVGAFSEADAARLSGLSVGQLREWDRSGFLVPSYGHADRTVAYSRVYSFRDLVSLRVLGQLRNTHKVSMQHLRQVSKKLSHLGDSKWISTTLFLLGKRVVFDDPRTSERKEIVSGQRVLDIPLKVAISDTRDAIRRLNDRSEAEEGNIVQHKFVLHNEPVFDRTRVSVLAVKRYIDAGYSTEQILQDFPDLTEADIGAARNYAGRNVA